MAVVPRFTIGGRLTLHNMTVFVFDDADYFFPAYADTRWKACSAIPRWRPWAAITVTDEDRSRCTPPKQIDPVERPICSPPARRFYLDGDQIIVALGRSAQTAAAGPAAAAGDPAAG